ncbi:MAG TPA: hypothetical protein VFS77_08230 [Pyrinomonadaceae bacterium]|nr:hypothetical protein [Pyrinomonadaceae bacterium]
MMNNEEFDRKMEFIVNQQAKNAVGIEKLTEAHARTEKGIEILTEKQAITEEVVTRLAYVTKVGFKDTDERIKALIDSQIRLRDSQVALTDSQAALTDSQKLTDEELRQLTATVDRILSKRRNGG